VKALGLGGGGKNGQVPKALELCGERLDQCFIVREDGALMVAEFRFIGEVVAAGHQELAINEHEFMVQAAAFDLDESDLDPFADEPLVDGVALPGVGPIQEDPDLDPAFPSRREGIAQVFR